MKIHKYNIPLAFFGEFRMFLHDGARILTFGEQHKKPTIWVLEDPVQRLVERQFFLVPTGGGGKGFEGLEYIGTIQMDGGDLVLHLFQPPLNIITTKCGVEESRPMVQSVLGTPLPPENT